MRIGIIGGGQLGMMMAEAANALGHSVISIDPNPQASITHFSEKHFATKYDNHDSLATLYNQCDVITYEFENIECDALLSFESIIPQTVKALNLSQNRFNEKSYASKLEIPVPKFWLVNQNSTYLGKGILKSISGGYDGKGQVRIHSIDDWNKAEKSDCIFEEFINYEYEIAIIASRDKFGNIVFYPTIENLHRQGILHISRVLGNIPLKITEVAQEYTRKLITDLHYIGTLSVEFFVCGDNVLFNEFAPRPHNSGHFSLDACSVSQFTNHILAITGQRVLNPQFTKAIMLNVLGQDDQYVKLSKYYKIGKYYDYFKIEKINNRKMGHITITGEQEEIEIKLNILLGGNINE